MRRSDYPYKYSASYGIIHHLTNFQHNDDHYDLEDSADKIEAQIPTELDKAFGISEWARENEEPEELSTWMNEGNEKLTKQKESA